MFRVLILLISFIIAAGCSSEPEETKSIDLLSRILKRGELIVLTTNQPTTYYIDREGNPSGPEYDMTQSFAESIGVKVTYIIKQSIDELIEALIMEQGDIAAAGITATADRAEEFDFGPSYMDVNEYLVCHRDGRFVEDADDLKGLEIVIPVSTSYTSTLHKEYPNIDWTYEDDLLTPDLLKKIRTKDIECTVSDSTIFDINRRYYPEISVKYTIRKNSRLSWMYQKNNSRLTAAISKWLTEMKTNGHYDQFIEKFYGHIDVFDYVDVQKFKRRMASRLPKYKDMFIKAAKENGISPALLAAQSYQESHWDRKAKSPTGVRGIMMLTQPVAKSLGVTNRLHAEQNIFAGAKYHAKMKRLLSEEITEPDRTWFALASYNVGRGHFRDAQALARKLGKNPYLWVDMKEVLPLLSQKKYYKDTHYGYARGEEPVQYVTRIRDYEDILVQYFTAKNSKNKIVN